MDIRASGVTMLAISWPFFIEERLKQRNMCGADLSGVDEGEPEEKRDLPLKKMRNDSSDEKFHK